MSAWVVSKAHIDAMVRAGIVRDMIPATEADATGAMLMNECVASVSYRYPDDGPGELPGPIDAYYLQPYTYTAPEADLSEAVLHVQLSCYEYQSCEHPGWESSQSRRYVNDLRDLLEPIARYKYTAEYENAPWGID